uniref:Tropomodulin n=1 Tax=Caligus rogercresseyi TaxID=217165 RepID=C1BNQ9_CALRO|nr:Tropomodulin [Caligus rogercresseyi]
MSRTMHFGRDILSAPDVDLEDLLNALAPSEIESLVNEMAADPDDRHLPASVRTAYHCKKDATGPLNRDSLINFINEEGINTPEKEEAVKYEKGLKCGKVYVPKYDEATLALMKKNQEVAEAVRLDDDEEAALSEATTQDLMTLAEILDSNPQEFIMEAYADPLKYYEPDPPNTTNPKEAISKVVDNQKELKEVCLNNIAGIDERDFCELFDGLRQNNSLVKFAAVNCEINDFAISTLSLAIENNNTLKSINLESNRISPDTLASLFEAIASTTNGVIEIHVSNQAQSNMGYRVESRIADAICKNNSLLKVGMKFQFAEVIDRVERHLISNIDRVREDRARNK